MLALQTLWVAVQKVFSGEILRHRVTEELASLTDRELADIGISRSDIRRIAREAVAASDTVTATASGVRRPARLAGSAQPV